MKKKTYGLNSSAVVGLDYSVEMVSLLHASFSDISVEELQGYRVREYPGNHSQLLGFDVFSAMPEGW